VCWLYRGTRYQVCPVHVLQSSREEPDKSVSLPCHVMRCDENAMNPIHDAVRFPKVTEPALFDI
jgi:hypothetical protein